MHEYPRAVRDDVVSLFNTDDETISHRAGSKHARDAHSVRAMCTYNSPDARYDEASNARSSGVTKSRTDERASASIERSRPTTRTHDENPQREPRDANVSVCAATIFSNGAPHANVREVVDQRSSGASRKPCEQPRADSNRRFRLERAAS
jgi:hypothetical protein